MEYKTYFARMRVGEKEIIERISARDDFGAMTQAVSRTHVNAYADHYYSGDKIEGSASLKELLDSDGIPVDIYQEGKLYPEDIRKLFYSLFEDGIYTAREPLVHDDEYYEELEESDIGAIFY